jgi:hypothetical protein
MSHRLPDLLLERYVLGEVSNDERRLVEDHLQQHAQCQARLAAIAASDADILATYPATEMVPVIEGKAARSPSPQRRSWRLGLALGAPALAVAGLLAVTLGPGSQRAVESTRIVEPTRIKGLVPKLFVHRQRGEQAERLTDGSTAREHDVLQLSYVAAGHRHGVILSIDGRGSVILHHPTAMDGDTTLLPTGEAALPHAYELDDAPSFERFFLITAPLDSHTTLDTQQILDAAVALARDLKRARVADLPVVGLEQTSLKLIKEEQR